jgi:hypothetical protein
MKNRTTRLAFLIGSVLILAFMLAPFAAFGMGPMSLGAHDPGLLLGIAGSITFLDLAKANSSDVVGGLIEENETSAPELMYFEAEDLQEPGQLSYQTLHRLGLPSVNFAHAGEGFSPTKSALQLKTHECFRFGGRVEAARHIADNYRRGGAAGYQAFEASGIAESALKLLGKQIYYGVAADGKGFPGMKVFTPVGGTYTSNAGGTTANTASSVYFVKFGEKYCRLMAGRARNGSGLMELPDFRIGDISDPNDATKKIEAYISELSSYVGLQIAAECSVVRIANLTADTGKGLTDAKMNAALRLFPANFRPDRIFMSRRSAGQLQDSRTVTLFGQGTTRPNQELVAPRPVEFEGIPITETDSILNTDAIE